MDLAAKTDEHLTVAAAPLSAELAERLMGGVGKRISGLFFGKFVVEARIDAAGLPLGEIAGKVHLDTGLPKSPTLSIPYKARIVPAAKTVPSTFFLRELRPATPVEETLAMSLRNGKLFKVLSVESDLPGLECRYVRKSPARTDLRLSLTPAAPPQSID